MPQKILCKDAKSQLRKNTALPLLRLKGWFRIVSQGHDEWEAHRLDRGGGIQLENMKHKHIKESGKTVEKRILSGSEGKRAIQLLALAGAVRRVR